MADKYFLDTYALISLVQGDEHIESYLHEAITLKENLVELYYFLVRKYNTKTADHFLTRFASIAQDLTLPLIRAAMIFKHHHKKENFSYVDCLGYTYACQNNRLFVTGDNAFRKLTSVQFLQ